MTNYCILDNQNIIINMIVCDDPIVASRLNAVANYPGASIGDEYDPYSHRAIVELKQQVADLNLLVNTLTGTE